MNLRALALAALAASLPAAARGYVRSTDGDTNACLYWKPRSVTYHVNTGRAASSASCGPATASNSAAAAAIEAGFAAWTGAQQTCTDLSLVRGADTSSTKLGFSQGGSNENLIVFRKGWCSNDDLAKNDPCFTNPSVRCGDTFNCFENTGNLGGTSIIALTTTTYSPASGEIVDADMEFVDWTGLSSGAAISGTRPQGWYFTCATPTGNACVNYGEANCYSMDLENTATHEVGHFIGFAHVPVSETESTMHPTAAVGEVKKRSLEADDVTGLCTVYPKAAATLVCVTPKKKSSGGCGTAGGLGALGLLALLALPRRRSGHRTTTPA